MPQRTGSSLAGQWLIAFAEHITDLAQDWLRSQVPILIELLQQARKVVFRERSWEAADRQRSSSWPSCFPDRASRAPSLRTGWHEMVY